MGFGTSPYGTMPYGLFAPAAAPVPPVRDAETKDVRFLDVRSRDYEMDPVTRGLKRMPTLRQLVLVRVMTAIRSASSQPELGINVPRYISATFQTDIEMEVRRAFLQETDVTKIMRIESVESEQTGTGRVRTTISYSDLISGTEDTVKVENG